MALTLTRTKTEGVREGQVTLHSSLGATDDGDWVDMAGIGAWSVHISGISGDTVRTHGSNKITIPADGDAEDQLGSDITADTVRQFDVPLKWFKVSCSTYGAGAITVVLKARNL